MWSVAEEEERRGNAPSSLDQLRPRLGLIQRKINTGYREQHATASGFT
jgi:hypothetical protein